MKIVVISDTHGEHKELEKWLPEADMIICGGDISKFGNMTTINGFLAWFSELNQYKRKIFIAGNHDKFFEEQRGLAQAIIPHNVIYLENSGMDFDGIYIYGSPMTPRFFDWAFNVDRGEKIKRYWDMIPEGTDILITHGPPMGVLDISFFTLAGTKTDSPNHAGCLDLMNRIKEVKPKVHIFGHIHPSYGTVNDNGTLFINGSNADSHYKMKNKPILIEIDEITKEVKLLSW